MHNAIYQKQKAFSIKNNFIPREQMGLFDQIKDKIEEWNKVLG